MNEKEDDAAVSSSATAFQSALNQFKKSLTSQQRQEFAICTVNDVETAIETIQERLGSQRRMRNIAKLSKFVEAMTQLGKVVEVFLNVESTVAFVWAPIKFILLAASTYTESLDALLDTYAEVGDILPQLTRYENLLEKHPELRKYVESYYCDVLDFHRKALEVFSRPAWKAVFHSAWKTFKTKFGPLLSNLKRHRDLISDEKLSIAISEVTDMRTSVEDKLDAMSRRIAEIKADEDQDKELRARNTNHRKRKHLLDILNPPNYRSDFDRACDRHETSSSQEWIFGHALVESWLDLNQSSTKRIFLHGIPGAGKTILTSRIVQHLDELGSSHRADGSPFSVAYFFFSHLQAEKRDAISLYLSIVSQLIYQDEVVLDYVYEKCHLHDHHTLRSSNTIRDLATEAIRYHRICYLVLDGLDECVGTSAASPDTEQGKVLDWLAKIGKKFKLSEEDTVKIISKVTGQAEGMFLYAKVVLDNLASQTSKRLVQQEMQAENFPQGLNEAMEIRASEIRQHTVTGYYGFLDYAAASWWKHAIKMAGDHLSLNKSFLDETFETIAGAMNSYRTPEASEKDEPCSAENIESLLARMTQDEWEWEAQFKMQDRVHKIRTVTERLLEHHGHEEAYLLLVPLYGALRYKCSRPWCRWFFYGFDAFETREDHLREHERPFRCLVEACYGSDIGFATESGLNMHDRRFHCEPTVDFPSLRPPKVKTESLHDAIEKDDLLTVKSLVSQGTDMNKRRYPTGMTPLQFAIHKGNVAICQYLLDSGTDINRPMLGSSRLTALHLAVQVDDADITYLLLCHPEVDPSALDSNFRTPFDLASLLVARNALSAFTTRWPPLKGIALLRSSAMPRLDEDWSAMSMYSNVALIMSLIRDSSSDLNAVQERLGQPPLSYLIEHSSVELVEALLSTGRVDLSQSSRSAISTIKQAISAQNPQMVWLVMSQFSDELLDQSPADSYALLTAVERSSQILLYEKREGGRNLMEIGLSEGNKEVVKRLRKEELKTIRL
ncbi:hypothetical protein DL767_001562 [Monosporascus sp. MG133]|nr:hypothetical protein DL767_001562 [Monosporascus sp. MG133]